MSTKVVMITKTAAMTKTHPIVTGKSRVFNASTNSFPIPFQPKIISTKTAPASKDANHQLTVVIIGLLATGKICRNKTLLSGTPLALAVRTKSIALISRTLFRVN